VPSKPRVLTRQHMSRWSKHDAKKLIGTQQFARDEAGVNADKTREKAEGYRERRRKPEREVVCAAREVQVGLQER